MARRFGAWAASMAGLVLGPFLAYLILGLFNAGSPPPLLRLFILAAAVCACVLVWMAGFKIAVRISPLGTAAPRHVDHWNGNNDWLD